MNDKPIHIHVYNINPYKNGGESIHFITEFYDNGDGGSGLPANVFYNQRIEMQSYSNSVSLLLTDIVTPAMLRDMADQLERELDKSKTLVNERYHIPTNQ
jgi:hypothetical protein